MPPGSSSNVKTYEALPPPKHQKAFPNRRRSAKAKTPLPKLTKSQSTLTQLDFGRTPMSSRQPIYISSDDDYEEERSKKRRRKSKFDELDPDQSTMTQIGRHGFPGSSKRSRLAVEDSFEIWEDYNPNRLTEEVKDRQNTRARSLPWLRESDKMEENENIVLEIPESSQLDEETTPKFGKELRRHSYAQNAFTKTPRKFGDRTEVPSSQSPPSTKHSAQGPVRFAQDKRSPLTDRSANAESSWPEPESQNVAMKMLERVRFETRKIPLNDSVRSTMEGEVTEAVEGADEYHQDVHQDHESETLQRISTIQDSQIDEYGLTIAANSAEASGRTLKRSVTVQDSEVDEDELEANGDTGTDASEYDLDLVQESQYYSGTFQSTFDPVHSALDRDAARFGLTQTQTNLEGIEESGEDGEADFEELDQPSLPGTIDLKTDMSKGHLQQEQTLTEPVLEQPLERLSQRMDEDRRKADVETQAPHDDSAYESGDPIRHDGSDLPSSPPQQVLRPSQISTVVPSQMSPAEQTSGTNRSPRKITSTQPFTFPSSPPRPSSALPETMSSSPLLLPPWRSPEKARCVNQALESQDTGPRSDDHPGSLVDFSLPPPPPMSSSRRQTPASSST